MRPLPPPLVTLIAVLFEKNNGRNRAEEENYDNGIRHDDHRPSGEPTERPTLHCVSYGRFWMNKRSSKFVDGGSIQSREFYDRF